MSDKCGRAITCVFCRELSLTLCSTLSKKKSVPRKVKFGRKFLTHTSIYCHACHKRFAIFLHLLHFCISSLVMMMTVTLILIINKLCYCDDDDDDDDNDRVKYTLLED